MHTFVLRPTVFGHQEQSGCFGIFSVVVQNVMIYVDYHNDRQPLFTFEALR